MIIETYKDIEIQAGGLVYDGVTASSANIDINDATTIYNIISTGTPSMGASYLVSTTGTAVKGHKVTIRYEATVDFNGNTLTLMGTTIDVAYQAKRFIVESIYDGTVWNTIVSVDFDQSDIIIADSIKDDSVTSVKILNSAITSAKILDGAITSAKLDGSFMAVTGIEVVIPAADVLTLFSQPIDLVFSPGGTEAYIPIAATMLSGATGTIPYATNTIIQIFQKGEQEPLFENNLLGFTAGTSKKYQLAKHDAIINKSQIAVGGGYNVTVKTGNPTAGDSDITIGIYYIIISH